MPNIVPLVLDWYLLGAWYLFWHGQVHLATAAVTVTAVGAVFGLARWVVRGSR